MLQTLIRILLPTLCFSATASFAETFEEKANKTLEQAEIKANEAAESAAKAKESEIAAEKSKKAINNIDIGGFNFSVGIGYEAYNSPYIKDAVLRGAAPNQIVVITDSYRANTSLWLTTNYVWDGCCFGSEWTHPGMYIGARIAGEDSNVFDAFGVGAMLVLRRNGTTKNNTFKSVNIGIGKVWHRTQELAYGITEGNSLPASYTQVEFQKRDESSWMLMLSVGFD
ncbi:MAG: hypothetical protein HWE24_02360 [Oceanospirillaceae bacterium]|nr:hypothetical protein [Oceanospirillaceae bacterium]